MFLDLDGTLADSLKIMREVYARFLNCFGKTDSDEEFASLNGPTLQEIVVCLADTHQLSPPLAELLLIYKNLIQAAYEDVVPNAGAEYLIKTAILSGFKIGVVTSNSVDLTTAWLHRVGLLEHVDTIVGGDDVNLGKPHPDPYLLALQRTGCEACESIAIEDSLMGVRASMTAGIQTFLLSNAPDEMPDGVLVASSLEEVAAIILKCQQERED